MRAISMRRRCGRRSSMGCNHATWPRVIGAAVPILLFPAELCRRPVGSLTLRIRRRNEKGAGRVGLDDPIMPPSNRPFLQYLARVGYAARGAVFVILGYFTIVAALDTNTHPVDSKDALAALLTAPFGSILLVGITLGLLCFALWREAQCFFDTDAFGSDLKGRSRRIVYGAAGLFYLGFASIALSMVIGERTQKTEHAVHDWTGRLLDQPFGQWLVGIIGSAIIVGAICIGVAGIRADFRDRIDLAGKERGWVVALGRAGYLIRATVFAVIGLFLVLAAIDANAHEATGLSGALEIIKRQTYGGALLGVVAAGFIAFGLYGIAEAFFRHIDTRNATIRRPSWISA